MGWLLWCGRGDVACHSMSPLFAPVRGMLNPPPCLLQIAMVGILIGINTGSVFLAITALIQFVLAVLSALFVVRVIMGVNEIGNRLVYTCLGTLGVVDAPSPSPPAHVHLPFHISLSFVDPSPFSLLNMLSSGVLNFMSLFLILGVGYVFLVPAFRGALRCDCHLFPPCLSTRLNSLSLFFSPPPPPAERTMCLFCLTPLCKRAT